MRTTDDLARELRTHPEGALFAVPALTPEQRLALDEIDPTYLKAVDHLREREIPMTRAAATQLVMTLQMTPALKQAERIEAALAPRPLPNNTGRTISFRRPNTFSIKGTP